MKRVVIVHGWHGAPEQNWFPWLSQELENIGVKVDAPQMPNPDFPVCDEWVETLKSLIINPDSGLFLVGHSLGVIAILRYLESLEAVGQVGGVVSVAGFPESVGIKEHESFFTSPLDYDKVKRRCQKFVVFQSDNDYYVPMREAEILRDQLGAQLIVVKNAGHFCSRDGYSQFPDLLDKVRSMIFQYN